MLIYNGLVSPESGVRNTTLMKSYNGPITKNITGDRNKAIHNTAVSETSDGFYIRLRGHMDGSEFISGVFSSFTEMDGECRKVFFKIRIVSF